MKLHNRHSKCCLPFSQLFLLVGTVSHNLDISYISIIIIYNTSQVKNLQALKESLFFNVCIIIYDFAIALVKWCMLLETLEKWEKIFEQKINGEDEKHD